MMSRLQGMVYNLTTCHDIEGAESEMLDAPIHVAPGAPEPVFDYSLYGLQRVACSLVQLLIRCSLLARQQLTDTAQRQIVAEDAKTRHRTTTHTGNLGDPAPPGWIGDVDFDRGEFDLAQSGDEGRMPR